MMDEALRGVNIFQGGGSLLTLLPEEEVANYVPAAAVIRRPRALSGIIGRKGSVGGLISLLLKHRA